MAPHFELLVGDRRIRAELLEREAPSIVSAFRACLPVESFAGHAKFAGQEIIVMLPFYADAENEVGSVAPGDIGYYPSRQTLCLFYGDIMPFASVSLFARVVPADLPIARGAGQATLAAGSVAVRLVGDRPAAGPTAAAARPTPAGRVVEKLAGATREIWAREPADVAALRGFSRPPMGNLPCVFYANFDLFWAGENLQVCRRLAREGRLQSADIGRFIAALLRQTRARVGKWGFADATALLDEVASELEKPLTGATTDAAALLGAIEAAQLYLGRLQSWVDALIPWSHLDGSLRLSPPAHGP